MIHLAAASACTKNIKGYHQAAVNLTFCIRAVGMKALINFFLLFLSDPSCPEMRACVQQRVCVGLKTEASDETFFPSASSEKELGHGSWEVPGMQLAWRKDLPMALWLTKINALARQHFYWGFPPPCASPHRFNGLFSWLWISFCWESPAQRNRCSATEEAQEIHTHIRSRAGRIRIILIPPVCSSARAKSRSFPAEPRGLSLYPARWLRSVGADPSLAGNPLQHLHLTCGETSGGVTATPHRSRGIGHWASSISVAQTQLWFPARACSPSRDRCAVPQHLAVCLPLF